MKEVFTADTYHELSYKIDSFMEDHDIYDYENVTIVIGKVKDDLANDEYCWRATLMPKPTDDALKDMLVEEHEFIDHFWVYEDIRGRAEELGYGDIEGDIDEISEKISDRVDCEYGLNWQLVDDMIFEVLGEPDNEDDDEEIEQPEVWDELNEWERKHGIGLNAPIFDKIESGLTPEQ